MNAVDTLLRKYRGREHGVYTKVCLKYGITPKPEWITDNKKQTNNKIKTNNLKNKPPPIKSKSKNTNIYNKQNKMKHKLSTLKNKKFTQKNSNRVKKPSLTIEKKKIIIEKQEESEDEYEDDFEDYSDDFEEESDIKSQSKIPTKKTESKCNVLIAKYNIKSSKTNILFSMRERSMDEQYLQRVGKEIYCRGIQSFYLKHIETQTMKNKQENKTTQYEFCDVRNKELNYDRQRLKLFLNKSSKLMNGLLSYNKNTLNNCDGYGDDFLSEGITFIFKELLSNRSINDITFSLCNNNIIAVAYSKINCNLNSNREDEKIQDFNIKYDGLVCVWDLRKHLFPIYELICDDEIKTIQFLPNDDNLIICGRQNGCIAVWDICETNTIQKKYKRYLRYPSYMTDCQWNKNHDYPIICLQFLNKYEFCSVDINGLINGWSIHSIRIPNSNSQILINESKDLCCTDMDTIKISLEFKFNIALHIYGNNNVHSIQSKCCLCVVPSKYTNETRMLFAYNTCVYMLSRIGSNVEIIEQYTLKYDIVGINYANNNVICVAVYDVMFVAGYENGMICLFNIGDSHPICRFYDMNNIQSVLSISWLKIDEHKLLLYIMFEDGRITFLHLKANQDTQTYIFEKILSTNQKSIKSYTKPCCTSINSFVAISNMTINDHAFSIHRINMRHNI